MLCVLYSFGVVAEQERDAEVVSRSPLPRFRRVLVLVLSVILESRPSVANMMALMCYRWRLFFFFAVLLDMVET